MSWTCVKLSIVSYLCLEHDLQLFNQTRTDHTLALSLCLSLPEKCAWGRLAKISARSAHHHKKVLVCTTVLYPVLFPCHGFVIL